MAAQQSVPMEIQRIVRMGHLTIDFHSILSVELKVREVVEGMHQKLDVFIRFAVRECTRVELQNKLKR